MRPRQGTHAATLALLAFAAAAAAREAPYHLVDNFSRPLPSSDRLACQPESEGAKVGLAACRVSYRLDRGRRAVLALPDPTAEAGAAAARRLPGAGALKLWVKGDGSGAELRLVVRHVTPFSDAQGRRRYRDHRDLLLRSGPLDFADWRELTFDASAVPPGKLAWWSRLELHGSRRKDAPTSGTILLDDLRLYPDKRRPSATAAAGLIGPSPRPFGSRVALFLDVRSFTRTPATVRARVTMTDRNENRIVDRDVGLRLPPFGSKEQALELEPKNLGAFLPPFTVACDVLSADLPDASMKVDSKLVMANCVALFDDFSDLFGHWFTAGFRATTSRGRQVWSNWTMGEAQRTNPWPQTSARIARVALGPDDAERGRFAMRLDFQGEAMVYRSLDRHLPGNPYRLALWVKGDGSGATLSALTLDYTDNADFWEGGWRRTRHGERTLCVLDFTGWRRVEAPLPGNGLGSNTPRGSTDAIDYPLELTGFRVRPAKDKPRGSVLLAAVSVHTQAPQAATLALHLAYDDPNHRYAPDRGAWLTVHNGWPGGDRRVRATWALLDRQGDEVAKGRAELHVPSGRSRAHRIGFPRGAAARQGPLRLRATAFAVDDASVSASRDIILAKPDSRAFVTGFEADRGYLGLKALGVESPPPAGQPAAHTSTDRAHGGKRSLALAWDKATRPTLYVAVDPPLPGVPVELSAWVFGDGSGALVYPVIGDSEGISHGAHDRQWDLFLARRDGAELQNVVRVDWKGWRELTFRLPPIPPSWREPLPVLGFEPSYPLGLHVAVDATDAASPRGTLYVDDVRVLTHLEPRERLTLALERPHEWNVVAPGGALRAVVANHDAAAPRKGTVSGGVFDWRGRRVAGSDVELQLGPGERRRLVVARDLPRGSYAVRLRLTQGQQTLATLVDDLLVADLEPVLGAQWPAALRDEWKLRKPIRDSFALVDEDWDWVEHYPGNVQLDTVRERTRKVAAKGARPFLLLGYSAYWAAGVGLEQVKAGAFVRRPRDAGHAVNTFLTPERLEDWDHYACELMRGVGTEVAGWVLWNNPDSGPIAVEAGRFARLLAAADRWRRVYCPDRPLLIGGMRRATALPYLKKLAGLDALAHFTGVNVRLDVGRLSPEDARVAAYVRELQALLTRDGGAKDILLTDLDWAVEKGSGGLGPFEQAAYLIRSDLLLHRLGVRPGLAIRNDDHARLGLGLTYRREASIPPLREQPATFHLKPAWWGIVRTRQWLDRLEPAGEAVVRDVVPGRTRCLLYRRKPDGATVAIAWRNDDPGHLTFTHTGAAVASAEDMFGSPVPEERGWYAVGRVPVVFVLSKVPSASALGLVRVRDGEQPTWPQRVLAAFNPATGKAHGYAHTGGAPAELTGRTAAGDEAAWRGLRFAKGGGERFEVAVPEGASVVLRKRYLLEGKGHTAEVLVNGRPLGTWDLRRAEPELSGGLREGIFVVDRAALGRGRAVIQVRYPGPANSAGWRVLDYRGGPFPLSAVGPVHADQTVQAPRLARNVVGGPLAVGKTTFANGIGTFARSLLDYSLNGQFRRFRASVGVDAATDGRGSVVFEVHGDGRKLWSSGVLSGLDEAKKVDVDVRGVRRLRLTVGDAGDGNRYDAADWCEPELVR